MFSYSVSEVIFKCLAKISTHISCLHNILKNVFRSIPEATSELTMDEFDICAIATASGSMTITLFFLSSCSFVTSAVFPAPVLPRSKHFLLSKSLIWFRSPKSTKQFSKYFLSSKASSTPIISCLLRTILFPSVNDAFCIFLATFYYACSSCGLTRLCSVVSRSRTVTVSSSSV